MLDGNWAIVVFVFVFVFVGIVFISIVFELLRNKNSSSKDEQTIKVILFPEFNFNKNESPPDFEMILDLFIFSCKLEFRISEKNRHLASKILRITEDLLQESSRNEVINELREKNKHLESLISESVQEVEKINKQDSNLQFDMSAGVHAAERPTKYVLRQDDQEKFVCKIVDQIENNVGITKCQIYNIDGPIGGFQSLIGIELAKRIARKHQSRPVVVHGNLPLKPLIEGFIAMINFPKLDTEVVLDLDFNENFSSHVKESRKRKITYICVSQNNKEAAKVSDYVVRMTNTGPLADKVFHFVNMHPYSKAIDVTTRD